MNSIQKNSTSPKTAKAAATRCRLLAFAITAFADREFHTVSIAEISREAGLTPQAVYRYFKGKDELFRAALEHDVETLQNSVLSDIAEIPLPTLTGHVWRVYSSRIDAHPLARKVITSRDHDMLEFISRLPSTRALFDRINTELTAAQRHDVIRTDINVDLIMESAKYLFSFVSLPLLCDGKYNAPEWLRVTYLFTSAIFYPMPDLQQPGGLDEINAKMADLAEKMVT